MSPRNRPRSCMRPRYFLTRRRALHPEHTPPVAGTEVLAAVILSCLGLSPGRSLSPSLEVRGCTVRVRSRPHLGPERLAQGAGFSLAATCRIFAARFPCLDHALVWF